MPKSLGLQRAEHALAAIENLQTKPKGDIGNYLAYVKGLPANILRSGLGQAMAIEKAGARSDNGHKFLYEHIDAWLTANRPSAPYRNKPGQLLKSIVSGDQATYVRAQAEALAYLEWLKKFAVGLLNDDRAAPAVAAPSETNEVSEASS